MIVQQQEDDGANNLRVRHRIEKRPRPDHLVSKLIDAPSSGFCANNSHVARAEVLGFVVDLDRVDSQTLSSPGSREPR